MYWNPGRRVGQGVGFGRPRDESGGIVVPNGEMMVSGGIPWPGARSVKIWGRVMILPA
jgi:hypothetical protein